MNPTGMDLSDDTFGLSHRPRKDVAVVDALDAYSEACRGLVQFGELTRGGGKRALGALPEDAPRPKGGGAAKAAAKAQRAKADALARTKHRVARAAFAEHEATVCRNPPRGAQIDYQKPVQVVAPSTA